ncbi:TraR/DksA family transcriptional regulator [Actinomadura sp. GC306]|nr:TraR/DksA family transcriptional regulator [Actinomadura sp. GC306]
MLPALPVEATSAREAGMAGTTKGAPPAEEPPAADPGPDAAETPAAGGPAARTARRAAAKRGKSGEARADGAPGDGDGRGGGRAQAAAAELPVREGEHQWTAAELAEVRAGLWEQIESLRVEIAASASQIAEGDTSDGAGDDQADAGAKTYAREHELALAYNSQDLLAQIERAVQRMDAGTYGICESCTKPIGKARLQVFPRATLCVTCKQREERR